MVSNKLDIELSGDAQVRQDRCNREAMINIGFPGMSSLLPVGLLRNPVGALD